MPDDLEDDVLGRFVAGDPVAFEALFRRHQGEVFRWALRIVRDPAAAEDVAIEAFWRAYRSRARVDPSRSFGAWLRRIASNAALDQLRSSRGRPRAVIVDDTKAPDAPDGSLREAIALAFERLSPKLRVVATLALVEQQPYAEIADALDVPLGTVKSRVSRAIDSLRDELARQGIRP